MEHLLKESEFYIDSMCREKKTLYKEYKKNFFNIDSQFLAHSTDKSFPFPKPLLSI